MMGLRLAGYTEMWLLRKVGRLTFYSIIYLPYVLSYNNFSFRCEVLSIVNRLFGVKCM